MIKKNVFLILLFLFSSSNVILGMSKCEKITNKLVAKFTKELQKKRIYAVGIGGSEKDGKNVTVEISFDVEIPLTIPTARQLLVQLENDFLTFFNAQNNIQQYMIEYPFTCKNLEFAIFGKPIDIEKFSHVDIVSAHGGKIYYYVNPGGFKPLIEIHKETFEEAVKLLEHN